MNNKKGRGKLERYTLLAILSITISFYFDTEIVKAIASIRFPLLDSFFIILTAMSAKEVVFIFLTLLLLVYKGRKKFVLPLWATLILTGILAFLLKVSVQRPRPFQEGIVSVLPALQEASQLVWNFSFPSFHAMLVFCVIPLISKEFRKFRYVWIIFAFLVAFSRVYFGVHFLSDVIAGGLLGYLIGLLIITIEEKYKFGERTHKKILVKE